jgi:hypothetical protein
MELVNSLLLHVPTYRETAPTAFISQSRLSIASKIVEHEYRMTVWKNEEDVSQVETDATITIIKGTFCLSSGTNAFPCLRHLADCFSALTSKRGFLQD